MRTFIAIPLPARARDLLGDLQQTLKSLSADVRWTAIPSIHLTLKFLGEMDPAMLPRLMAGLQAQTQEMPTFPLSLQGLGAFPDLRSPRVIWCGLGGDLVRLEALQTRVEAACTGIGFPPEDRPFHPHLTLGRVRSKTNLHPLVDYIKIGAALDFGFEVNDCHVYQSTLRPQGPLYAVLAKVELEGVGRS